MPAKAGAKSGKKLTAASEEETFKAPRGYKAVHRDGALVYCKSEGMIGTRFASNVCYTPQELKDVEERRRIASDELTRRARVCSTAAVCTNQ